MGQVDWIAGQMTRSSRMGSALGEVSTSTTGSSRSGSALGEVSISTTGSIDIDRVN